MPSHALSRRLALTALAAAAVAACAAPAPNAPAAPRPPPAAHPPAGMTLSALPSGSTQSTAGMAFEGGRRNEARTFVTGAILVDHPKGALLFDAGYGRDVAEHFKTAPAIMQALIKPQLTTPVAEQLAAGGMPRSRLKAVVLTHAHWDHVSGLQHLAGVPVWVPKAELDFVTSGDGAAKLARKLGVADRYAAARALADHEIAVPIGSGHDAIRTDAAAVSWADEAQQGGEADGRLVARTGGRQGYSGGFAPDPRDDEPPGGGGPRDAGARGSSRVRAPLAGAAEPRGQRPELYLEPAGTAARGFGGFADEGGHGPRPDFRFAEDVAVQAAGNGVAGNPLHQLGAAGRGLPAGYGLGVSARSLGPLARLGLVGLIAIVSALAFGALLAGLHALQSLI